VNKEEMISELKKLVSPEGFKNEILHSEEIWRSDPELYDWIFSKMNYCTTQLISSAENNSSKRHQKRILKSSLDSFRRIDFDTEDAEFVTDCFDLLSKILDIKFADNLMRWLYGPVIWILVKIGKFFNPEKVIAKKSVPCTNCNATLSIELKSKGSGNQSNWVIGKCVTCKEYNLMETFDNAKRTTYSNFYPSEYLLKDEFDEEKAKIRLEQIKYFRK
jgi:Domain of unknown function (DUF4844)